MPYIKKIYLEGFKSFAKPTEIIFDKGLNVIVGPNGSGKSNIIDAICFVLGRLSVKSLRAERASSLIFKGTKESKPKEKAIIKAVFDNSDGIFIIENEKPKEVVIERILKSDGSSIYKINGKTKTRNELLELLSKAGINPYGFNLIPQQEIFKFVEMKPDERRKLIEELAGINVYEVRKEKALRELGKTEEKIKEINAILKEKTNFLNNLEKEKKQALLYNKLKEQVALINFSIVMRQKEEKLKEKNNLIDKNIKLNEEKRKKEILLNEIQEEINKQKREIETIDSYIENITGTQQIDLQREITELKTKIAKLEVKRDTLINSIEASKIKIKSLETEINSLELEIEQLKEKQKEKLVKKDAELISEIDKKIKEKKERLNYLLRRKSQLEKLLKEREILKEKLNFLNKQFLDLSNEITKRKEELMILKSNIVEVSPDTIKKLEKVEKEIDKNKLFIKEREKIVSKFEREKEMLEKDLNELNKLEICPKCKRVLDEDHRKKLVKDIKNSIKDIELKIKGFLSEINHLNREINILEEEKAKLEKEKIALKENENLEKRIAKEKNILESLLRRKKEIRDKIVEIESRLPNIDSELRALHSIEDEIESVNREINELFIEREKVKNKLNLAEKINLDLEIKERELENVKSALTKTIKEKEKAEEDLNVLQEEINELNLLLKDKQEKYDEIYKKFSDLIEKKNKLHKSISDNETKLIDLKHEISLLQNDINAVAVELAKIDAEISVIEDKAKEFGMENFDEEKIIKLPIPKLEEKLQKYRQRLEEIGNVNLLALETYEKVKQEVDDIKEKLEKIDEERNEIVKQIQRIDREKKKVFLTTFEKINKEFGENFAKLSDKGIAKLILEDPKEPFNGGVDIVLQVGKGKYFDSTSLSGGEKVLIALAFIFAIQKLNPYPFYIFDEVDAALDKRNSERFASLLKKHIGKHQCIIITHNDATVAYADLIYGVSMQQGISKVFSLKL